MPLRYLPRRIRKRTVMVGVRLFTAVMLFMVLTITVLERPDHDGYQATHLFFMPRRAWEMDHGRGMLYPEWYYTGVDLEIMAEELGVDFYDLASQFGVEPVHIGSGAGGNSGAGSAARKVVHRVEEHEEYEEYGYSDLGPGRYEEYEWVEVEWGDGWQSSSGETASATATSGTGASLSGPRLQRAPHEPGLRNNTIPLSSLSEGDTSATWQVVPLASVAVCLSCGRGDVPTPPPRAIGA